MEIESDKERTTLAMVVARMWKDPEYKRRFISDPKSLLKSEGVSFGDHTAVKVVEETPAITYVDLASAGQNAQETVARLLPLADRQELRVVQSTDSLRYLILPSMPAWIAPGATNKELFETKQSATSAAVSEVAADITTAETQVMDSTTFAAATLEQTAQQSMEAEGLIAESAVAVETVDTSVQELQVMEVEAEAVVMETATVGQYIA
jgi:hypothetical protein